MPLTLTDDAKLELLQSTLDDFFKDAIVRSRTISPDYARLWETTQRLSLAGGKRLRPRMTLLAYEAFGGTDTASIIPVAAAQELLHLSLLVHDDIIDRDDVRYGIPNLTGSYMTIYQSAVSDDDDRRHYSQSAAILSGDVLLSSAYQLIVSSQIDDKLKIAALRLLGEGIFEVCGGELLDTEAAFKAFADTDAMTIARYKTASYSFILPLVTGAALAGANSEQLQLLRTYAETLGIAYQLTDDLIGSFGDEHITGKTTLGDIHEAKHTYLVERHIETLTPDEAKSFWEIFGHPDVSDKDVAQLKQQIIDSGAKSVTEQYIEDLSQQARQSVHKLNCNQSYVADFMALIDRSTKRIF